MITIARKLRTAVARPAQAGRGRRLLGATALVTLVALAPGGCASTGGSTPRGPLMKRLLASTVQLRAEREGGVRRAGSGVVVASDPATMRSWVVTAGHLVEPAAPQIWSQRRSGSDLRQDVSVPIRRTVVRPRTQ